MSQSLSTKTSADYIIKLECDGHRAMEDYYSPWVGKIHIARYEMLNPQVVVDGNMALLTYNLVNYLTDDNGAEAVGSRWNSTTVYQRGSAVRCLYKNNQNYPQGNMS